MPAGSTPVRRQVGGAVAALATIVALTTAACTAPQIDNSPPAETPTAAPASTSNGLPHASDKRKPDLIAVLTEYGSLWKSSGKDDLQGRVLNTSALQWNDRLTSWINEHATAEQQFRALQDAQYVNSDGDGYDQSLTIADGLGERLGTLYLRGRATNKLPLTSDLLNNSTGAVGKYVSIGRPKSEFSYPRPFLRADPKTTRAPSDSPSCAPSVVNASSLAVLRRGQPWADGKGNLKIARVPSATDDTRRYVDRVVSLDGAYGYSGICMAGSFPSGHSADAYASGTMLATMLPELALSILARTSEAANNRVVLGAHYPLDVIGGRMSGQAAVAERWADQGFRTQVIVPARDELVKYLEASCGAPLSVCIASDTPYRNDPYGGVAMPGGTRQAVADRASALAVYSERLSYSFAAGDESLPASLPSHAEDLLLTAFPTLSDAQRRAVLAQTEEPSGHPLDTSQAQVAGRAPGSWQRLNLAAAMSATVALAPSGKVRVVGVGGGPRVQPG